MFDSFSPSFGPRGLTFPPHVFQQQRITISITCHPSEIVVSPDCKDTEFPMYLVRGVSSLGISRQAGLSGHLICDHSSYREKDVWPLICSQEGKLEAGRSGEVIKGSVGNEGVRTGSTDTSKEFGLSGERSVLAEIWCWGCVFSKLREAWLYLNADEKEPADEHC